jgi:hypothetical protein
MKKELTYKVRVSHILDAIAEVEKYLVGVSCPCWCLPGKVCGDTNKHSKANAIHFVRSHFDHWALKESLLVRNTNKGGRRNHFSIYKFVAQPTFQIILLPLLVFAWKRVWRHQQAFEGECDSFCPIPFDHWALKESLLVRNTNKGGSRFSIDNFVALSTFLALVGVCPEKGVETPTSIRKANAIHFVRSYSTIGL